jgi:predicted RNase H-like HicB family nuclease
MHRFLGVIEKASGNYSAYSQDLLGCIATGKSHEEAERNIHEEIQLHVQGLIEDGEAIPISESCAEYIAGP